MTDNVKIAVVGLGYVGLPLACLFAGGYSVTGFDLNTVRVDALNGGLDCNGDIEPEVLARALANGLRCTTDPAALRGCNFYVIAVPTPVDDSRRPDLAMLRSATRLVGAALKRGDTVVYESTVAPGTTEEVCAPLLEQVSGLKLDRDFGLGFSPERINPGDRVHTVENIRKITSGSTPAAAMHIDAVYSSVIPAGTFRASSIKVAEAAKIIENTQRDVNIAFINEMKTLFDAMGIDTLDVVEAAATKWNFLPFKPGLVGGHCIGVDPYYLIDRAEELGVHTRLTAEARRINEDMPRYVARQVVEALDRAGRTVRDARVLVLGFTFKENCRDLRNTKAAPMCKALAKYVARVDVHDPVADPMAAFTAYGLQVHESLGELPCGAYDAVVYAVDHEAFHGLDLRALAAPGGVVYDLKGALRRSAAHGDAQASRSTVSTDTHHLKPIENK